MTKNEIVARWLELDIHSVDEDQVLERKDNGFHRWINIVKFDYNLLHEAWVKFRDLKFTGPDDNPTTDEIHHMKLCASIMWAITNKSITEAFDELVKGIDWYNNIKK